MSLYCVRLPETHPEHPGEIVGVFSASSKDELMDLVDECCDVWGLEYANLPSGGIMWEERGPRASDLYQELDEESESYKATLKTGNSSLTGRLHSAFRKGLKWKVLATPEDQFLG
jgi:hypothetical protein